MTRGGASRLQPQQQQQHFVIGNNLSVSTDAISLDGLLDCVSSGSFSSPPSPKAGAGHRTIAGEDGELNLFIAITRWRCLGDWGDFIV